MKESTGTSNKNGGGGGGGWRIEGLSKKYRNKKRSLAMQSVLKQSMNTQLLSA